MNDQTDNQTPNEMMTEQLRRKKTRPAIHLNDHARRIILVALETQREVYERASRKNAKQPAVAQIYDRLAAEIDDLTRSIK